MSLSCHLNSFANLSNRIKNNLATCESIKALKLLILLNQTTPLQKEILFSFSGTKIFNGCDDTERADGAPADSVLCFNPHCLPPVIHSESAANEGPSQRAEQQTHDLNGSHPHPLSLLSRPQTPTDSAPETLAAQTTAQSAVFTDNQISFARCRLHVTPTSNRFEFSGVE